MENMFEVSITKKDLVRALSHTQSASAKMNTPTILAHVLVSTTNDCIEFITTDIDIVLSERVPAQIIAPGTITMDAATTYEIARKLDDKANVLLKFDSQKSVIAISSGSCIFHLQTLSPSEFPKLDDLTYNSFFKIGVSELRSLIDKCKFAISNDSHRYNMNGIFMRCHDSVIKFVASDGHRVSIACSSLKTDLQDFEGVIIPQKTILEIRKILEDASGDIEIHLAHNKIKFSNNNFNLTSRLTAAQFPDYENFIPKNYDIQIEILKIPFSMAMSRISSITNEKFRGVKLVLEGNYLLISAHNDNVGFAFEKIEVQNPTQSKIEMGFNAKYITEVLDVMKCEKIRFCFKDPFSPATITEPSALNFLYVIMPMRT